MTKMKKKTIAIYPFHMKRHGIYGSTLDFLRKNYDLIYYPRESKKPGVFHDLSHNKLIRNIYFRYIRRFISLNELLRVFRKDVKRDLGEKYDLLFAMNGIPDVEGNFVIDIENIIGLGGNDYHRLNREHIKEALESPRCKAIICWNEISKRSVVEFVKSKKIEKKIVVIPFATKWKKVQKPRSKRKIDLLFVSSVNNPGDFERKGGIMALEVFSRLSEKHKDLRFNVRAKVSDKIKEKYAEVNGINFIESFLSDKEMKKLFLETDVLLEPVPGFNLLLECMEYKIPVVSSNFWASPEMIIDNKSGFIIDFEKIFGDRKNVLEYTKNLEINTLKFYGGKIDEGLIENYVEKVGRLIEDKNLRENMGEYASNMLRPGKYYSVEKRNKALKKILDNALKD